MRSHLRFTKQVLCWSLLLLVTGRLPAQMMHNTVSSTQQIREPFVTHMPGKVIYHLYITDTTVNYTGKIRPAIAINGTIPAPQLDFTEGDSAVIYVHNLMHMETSIHWHGLIVPNDQDGVPYLTTAPIKGHTTHIFRFRLVQNGTYWYHSHTMLQEQSGMYGALIIHPAGGTKEKTETLLLSDWTDENPHQVERSLHFATDWYGIRKKATQDYAQAIREGKLGIKLKNEWKRMLAMDVSDVYYDKLLTNGHPVDSGHASKYQPGDTIRLRIINGSASTYFWIQFSGGKMMVVASDGKDVTPVAVDRFIVGVSETYDVKLVLPGHGRYELLATSEDRTNHTSFWLGKGPAYPATVPGRLKYFAGMKMMNDMTTGSGKMTDMGMNMSLQQMDMNTVMYPEIADSGQQITTLNYAMLRAPEKTTLPAGPVRELRFELTGNMSRYVWTMDNKTISESDKILIRQGENIRIILTNNSMMRHPMHLHGHFFRVLNGQGDYAPMKTVLDIMPMETDTLEFHASEKSGDWYFHCHILYHMMAGMGKIFSYENSEPNPQIPDPKKAIRRVYRDDRRFYFGADIGLESNSSDGEIRLANTRYLLQAEWRAGYTQERGYETEAHLGRFIGRQQFLMPYIGWDFRYRPGHGNEKNLFGQANTKDKRSALCLGVQYTLPMLLKADARIDTDGQVRLQIGREDIPVSSRLRLNFFWNTDKEYMTGLRYIATKYLSLSTHYDSDMGYGAGITITY